MSRTREHYLPIHRHSQGGTDCGCDMAGCCLQCPLPACKYEDVKLRIRLEFDKRDKAVITMLQEGLSRAQVAHRFRVSKRTIERIESKYQGAAVMVS